ncbi:MAG: methyltransferase domain-containing protein [Chthoniobacterales bacterium]
MEKLRRESGTCSACSSTARERAIIRALSLELFGESLALPDFPLRPDIKGLGMTDSGRYASRLREKLGYQNTYYHQEPRLDVAAEELSPDLIESSDFIISSEVFEHILPPVERAFQNVLKILRPGGVFILTVPYRTAPDTIEHFPGLHDFVLIEENGKQVLRNVRKDGVVEEFRDLVFHMGSGATLEMRVFSERDLLRHLQRAGFETPTVHRCPDFKHGVWWPEAWSFPISGKKPDPAKM